MSPWQQGASTIMEVQAQCYSISLAFQCVAMLRDTLLHAYNVFLTHLTLPPSSSLSLSLGAGSLLPIQVSGSSSKLAKDSAFHHFTLLLCANTANMTTLLRPAPLVRVCGCVCVCVWVGVSLASYKEVHPLDT